MHRRGDISRGLSITDFYADKLVRVEDPKFRTRSRFFSTALNSGLPMHQRCRTQPNLEKDSKVQHKHRRTSTAISDMRLPPTPINTDRNKTRTAFHLRKTTLKRSWRIIDPVQDDRGEEAVYNKLCVKVDNEESSLRNILKLSSDNIKILRRFKENLDETNHRIPKIVLSVLRQDDLLQATT